MAPIRFNAISFMFRAGIDPLQASFDVALRALEGEIDKALLEAQLYAEGEDNLDVRDDDGCLVVSHAENLAYEIGQAEEAQDALCKAFALAVYHQWERSIQLLTGAGSRSRHPDLVKAAEAKSFQLHPRLPALRDLANALKHNSQDCGAALVDSWPELFGPDFKFNPQNPPENWYELIQLHPEHVREVFEIALGSGPQITS